MAITKSLTWQYDVNITLPATASSQNDSRQLFRRWKNALIGFATLPWAVSGSSDSVSAGMDGVDRWTDDTKLVGVNTSGAHSWIVLRCPVTGMQILLDLIVTSTVHWSTVRFKVSPGGLYTGGTTSAAPTATDERTITVSNYGRSASTSGTNVADLVLHVVRSTGGEATAWALCYSNTVTAVGYVGKLEASTNASLLLAGWLATDASTLASAPLNFSHAFDQWTTEVVDHRFHLLNLPVNSSANGYLVAPGVSTQNSLSQRTGVHESRYSHVPGSNQILNEHEHPSIGLYCHITGDKGIHGRMYDIRWAGDELTTGDTFPADGTKLWVKLGPWLFPWNGSIPITA